MAETFAPREQPKAGSGHDEGNRLRGWALASVLSALMATLLLAALDQTIVSTALPHIILDLHGFDRYTWVVTAYLLTSTTTIPIVGKLSDQFGRKWFVVVGVLVFLLGSALSGAAQDMTQLIMFRGLQGIGAGMAQALIFTLIGDIFTPAERARWQGLFAGVFALASVVGPAVGGWLTDNVSWRWVFYVNLPLGVIALTLLIFKLPTNISVRSTTHRGWAAARRIDFGGVFTAAAGTVCLLLGLTWGGNMYAWNSPQVIGILSSAVVFFIAFVVVERFAVEPILPADLFRNQVFAAGSLLSLTVGMALFAVVIYLPLFIQGVLGQPATNSGLVTTPLTLTMAAGATLVGLLISRIGRYQFASITGAFIMAFGIFLLTRLTDSTPMLTVTRDMVVLGVGLGMLQPVLTLAVQNALPRTRLGVGTGAVTYLRSMGSTLGVAVIGSLVNNTITPELARRMPAAAKQLPPQLLSAATNQQVLINPAYRDGLVKGTVHAAVQQSVPKAVAAATAQVPAGPNHDQMVATVTAQVTQATTHQVTTQMTGLLHQIFEATRQALAVGIVDSFRYSIVIAVAIIIITFFLKDVPLVSRLPAKSATPDERVASGEDEPVEVAPVGL